MMVGGADKTCDGYYIIFKFVDARVRVLVLPVLKSRVSSSKILQTKVSLPPLSRGSVIIQYYNVSNTCHNLNPLHHYLLSYIFSVVFYSCTPLSVK